MGLSGMNLTFLISVLSVCGGAHAAVYKIDSNHSEVKFSVKHMVISTVSGNFRDVGGEFKFDPKSNELESRDFTVKADSIDTGNAKRDGHLKSADFFDVEKCPTLTMTKSKVKKTGAKSYEWSGDLTMHCVSKPVKFDVNYVGSVKDPKGDMRAAFNAKTKLNRGEWGLKYNKAIEAGGVVVGEEVDVELVIQGIEEKVAQKSK